MAAYQLAIAGIKVLVLEAGRLMDHRKEYRTMEWPYASPRRSRLPPDHRAIAVGRVQLLRPPLRQQPRVREVQEARLLRGQLVHAQLGGQREAAPDHRHALLVGARPRAGGQDELLGPRRAPLRAARSSRPPAATASTWTGPSATRTWRPTTTRWTCCWASRAPRKAWPRSRTASTSAPIKLNCVEVHFKRTGRQDGPPLHPGPLRGHHRRHPGQQVPRALPGPRAVLARVRHRRRPSIRRPRSSSPRATAATSPCGRTRCVSEVILDPATGRAAGVRVIDANTREVMDFKAKVVVLGAGCLDSTRILLNSKSPRHPDGLGNSSGLLGCYLSEHHMGPRGSGFIPMRIGTEPTLDDGRPTGPYIPRFRNVTDKHPDFIRGYHFQGGGGAQEYPGHAHDIAGLRQGLQVVRPQALSRADRHRRLRRGAAAEGEPGLAGRHGEGRLGHPGPALRLSLQRQRDQDGEGHGRHRRGDAAARPARRTSRSTPRCCPPAGRSTRSAPRAWATTRRPRSPTASAACTTCPTSTSPTRRPSSPAAPRTRRGRSWPCAGARWTT